MKMGPEKKFADNLESFSSPLANKRWWSLKSVTIVQNESVTISKCHKCHGFLGSVGTRFNSWVKVLALTFLGAVTEITFMEPF